MKLAGIGDVSIGPNKRELREHRHVASMDVIAGQHHEHHSGSQPGAGKPQCTACRAICFPRGELGRVSEGSIPDCRPRYLSLL